MASKDYVNTYSKIDRALHRMAFASGGIQEAVADIEDRMNRRILARIPLVRPVFITALPRAGTTMLLNLLYESGEFATHTYRSMPFVLCPLTWAKLSGALRQRRTVSMERAHGDGMTISPDSAEAFEEMLWQQFFTEHYKSHMIEPWGEKEHSEFAQFFENHLRKQLLLDAAGHEPRRYMSKNNMNVARIPFLKRLYPQADILVPFRDPLQQASSLLRQHRRFLAMHQSDPFSQQYMRGIGHYEFGANLLPINFDRWIDRDRREDALTLSFWLEYWQSTYTSILKTAHSKVRLISFDGMVRDPVPSLDTIAACVGMRNPETLVSQSGKLHPVKPHRVDLAGVSPKLIESVAAIWGLLNQRAITGQ